MHLWNCDYTRYPDAPDKECHCLLPGEQAISPVCGHVEGSRCPGCGTCLVCDACYCYED